MNSKEKVELLHEMGGWINIAWWKCFECGQILGTLGHAYWHCGKPMDLDSEERLPKNSKSYLSIPHRGDLWIKN